MTSTMARIWVHRRHEAFPEVGLGFQNVPVKTASRLIDAGCAQDWQTDARRLKAIDPDTIVEKPKRRTSGRKTDESSAPPRRYRRRDIRPETP